MKSPRLTRVCTLFTENGGRLLASSPHALTTFLGAANPICCRKKRGFSEERFEKSKVQEESFVHVEMEPAHHNGFSVTLTQEDFAKNPKLLPTSSSLWEGRTGPLSSDYIKLRQCKSGEWRRDAAVSRPDICARSARIAPRINALCWSDVYRMNELGQLVKDW